MADKPSKRELNEQKFQANLKKIQGMPKIWKAFETLMATMPKEREQRRVPVDVLTVVMKRSLHVSKKARLEKRLARLQEQQRKIQAELKTA